MQVYSRLNHTGVCLSYVATLRLVDDIRKLHTTPLSQRIPDDVLFKFWGDNVDFKEGVHDVRSDHHGQLLHMYSVLVGRSRTSATKLGHAGCVSPLTSLPAATFLPTPDDFSAV